jgi:hypothetical protein
MRAKAESARRSMRSIFATGRPARVDAVDAAGGEQVALLQVGVGGHEAQLQPAAVRRGVAEGHAAHAGAGVLHGNGQVAVDHQRDLAREGQHLRDLAEHAARVDHRRAGRHALREPWSMTILRVYGSAAS